MLVLVTIQIHQVVQILIGLQEVYTSARLHKNQYVDYLYCYCYSKHGAVAYGAVPHQSPSNQQSTTA